METRKKITNQKCKYPIEYIAEIDLDEFLQVVLEVRGGGEGPVAIHC